MGLGHTNPDWRYEKRFIPFSALPGGGENFPNQDPPPDEEPDQCRLRQDVERALESLEPLDRKIFEMNQGLDGDDPLKKTEIAKRLGLSRTTVHKRLKRAEDKLRLELITYSSK